MRDKTAFVLIDIQEKFIPVINKIDKVIKNSKILIKGAEILGIPLIVTEQYPKGLGNTIKEIELPPNTEIIEKLNFNCLDCDDFVDELKKFESLVIFGIESHVCVLQTALAAKKEGIKVYAVADAISSRTEENKQLAIDRMRQHDIEIVSTEMILFELLKKAGTDEFKDISTWIK